MSIEYCDVKTHYDALVDEATTRFTTAKSFADIWTGGTERPSSKSSLSDTHETRTYSR